MNFCPSCGAEVKAEAKFCPKCGNNLGEQTTAETPETEPKTATQVTADFTDKMKTQFVKMSTDYEMSLEMEDSEGMNVTRAELKKEAQRKLSGRYGEWFKTIMWYLVSTFFLGFLSMYFFSKTTGYAIFSAYQYNYIGGGFFSGVATLFWFILFLVSLVILFLIAMLTNAVLQWNAIFTLKGKKADGVKIFTYFVRAQKNRVLKANILTMLYTFFWSLLFIIPGIVKGASYAMTNYLLEKEPTLTASQAINKSREIMHGYKLEFLILRYSFFFWNLVSGFGFGSVQLYTLPYQNVTEIKFLDLLYEKYEATHAA